MGVRPKPNAHTEVNWSNVEDEPLAGFEAFRTTLQRFSRSATTASSIATCSTHLTQIRSAPRASTSKTQSTPVVNRKQRLYSTPLQERRRSSAVETPASPSLPRRRSRKSGRHTGEGTSDSASPALPILDTELETNVDVPVETITTVRRSTRLITNDSSPHFRYQDSVSSDSDFDEASNDDKLYREQERDKNFEVSDDDGFDLTQIKNKRRRARSSPDPEKPKPKKPFLAVAHPSIYAHLDDLPQYLLPGLDLIICGINPGVRSASTGHHYAHPSNHFYKCLHQSGFTDRRVAPAACHKLVKKASIGLTNLVSRPTRQETELTRKEKIAGCPLLLERLSKNRPHFVAFAGMDVGRIFRDFIIEHSSASTIRERLTELIPPPVIAMPPLDERYDSDEEDYFVPASARKKSRKVEIASEAPEMDLSRDVKPDQDLSLIPDAENHDVPPPRRSLQASTVSPEAASDVKPGIKVESAFGLEYDIKQELKPDLKSKEDEETQNPTWALDLGLQPVVVTFPPLDPTVDPRRTKTYLWLFPSPSGLVRPYQLPDKIKMFSKLKAAITELKFGNDIFQHYKGEVREYRGEEILAGLESD